MTDQTTAKNGVRKSNGKKNGTKNGTEASMSGTKNGTKNGTEAPLPRAKEERLTVPLSAILPSPDKVGPDGKVHFEEVKIAALIHSIRTLGDWVEAIHCVAGPRPHTYCQWEQHSRVEALRRIYGDAHRVQIVVDTLTAQQRLQRMAESNGEVYGDTPVTRAEVVMAGVRHFKSDLPTLVARGVVKAIDPNSGRYYDAASATPYAVVQRSGEKLPPHAFSSDMLAAYVFQHPRSVQRSLVALNGASRLNVATADYMSGLNRDEAETVGRVMSQISGTDKRPLSEKSQKSLRSFIAALKSHGDGEEVVVRADGKEVPLNIDALRGDAGEDNVKAIAAAISTNKLTVATIEHVAEDSDQEDDDEDGEEATPGERRRDQVNKMLKWLKTNAQRVTKFRTKSGKTAWRPEDAARVADAADAFALSVRSAVTLAVASKTGRATAKKSAAKKSAK